ncbi:MAG: hypothetical protein ACE15C_01380 [Phycisphaerae bacterium]
MSQLENLPAESSVRPWTIRPPVPARNADPRRIAVLLDPDEEFDPMHTAMPSRRWYEEALAEPRGAHCAA